MFYGFYRKSERCVFGLPNQIISVSSPQYDQEHGLWIRHPSQLSSLKSSRVSLLHNEHRSDIMGSYTTFLVTSITWTILLCLGSLESLRVIHDEIRPFEMYWRGFNREKVPYEAPVKKIFLYSSLWQRKTNGVGLFDWIHFAWPSSMALKVPNGPKQSKIVQLMEVTKNVVIEPVIPVRRSLCGNKAVEHFIDNSCDGWRIHRPCSGSCWGEETDIIWLGKPKTHLSDFRWKPSKI